MMIASVAVLLIATLRYLYRGRRSSPRLGAGLPTLSVQPVELGRIPGNRSER